MLAYARLYYKDDDVSYAYTIRENFFFGRITISGFRYIQTSKMRIVIIVIPAVVRYLTGWSGSEREDRPSARVYIIILIYWPTIGSRTRIIIIAVCVYVYIKKKKK